MSRCYFFRRSDLFPRNDAAKELVKSVSRGEDMKKPFTERQINVRDGGAVRSKA